MKFEFQVDDDLVEPRVIRAMLMRGFYAFKAAKDEAHRQQELKTLQAESKPPAEDLEQFMATTEKLRVEEELWKQILVSFTKVTE